MKKRTKRGAAAVVKAIKRAAAKERGSAAKRPSNYITFRPPQPKDPSIDLPLGNPPRVDATISMGECLSVAPWIDSSDPDAENAIKRALAEEGICGIDLPRSEIPTPPGPTLRDNLDDLLPNERRRAVALMNKLWKMARTQGHAAVEIFLRDESAIK